MDSPGSGFATTIDYGQYQPCRQCGWFHVGQQCIQLGTYTFTSNRLSDDDVERIAKRVAELLQGGAK